MLKRSTIFLGLMLTGSLAAAALVRGEDAEVVAPVASSKPVLREAATSKPVLPVLQLEKLARADVVEPEQDPFAGKSWYVPPPPPPPPKVQEAPRPTAPPLPFHYMGRMQEEGGQAVIYLTQGRRAYSLSLGDTIDGIYRLDSISQGQIVLTYLPLDTRQSLNTGSAASPEMGPMANIAPLHGNIPDVPESRFTQDSGNIPQ